MSLSSENKPHFRADNSHLSGVQRFLLILLGAAFFITYFSVIHGLVRSWAHSGNSSYGFFIVPIAIYAIWTQRKRLVEIPANSSWSGLVVIVFSLIIYLFAHFAGILTIVSLSMVLFLVGVVLFFYGFQMLKELSFPLVLLLLMIPIPNQIYSKATIPLQLFVSQVSVLVASLMGVPVLREGNVIHLPTRTLEVVQACSGLRSLVTLIILGLIIAYFTLRAKLLRFLLVVSSIFVAIFVNIVRILVMIFAFYFFDIDLTTDAIHASYGLVIFTLAIVITICLKGVLSFWDSPKTQK